MFPQRRGSVMRSEGKMIVGVPNNERLQEPTLTLLARAAMPVRLASRACVGDVTGKHPARVVLLRSRDMPDAVERGVVTVAVTTQSMVAESERNVAELALLSFSHYRVVIASRVLDSVSELRGRSVATTFPRLTARYLHEQGIDNVAIFTVTGSTEAYAASGAVDAIVDICASGATLRANALRPIGEILRAQAVLITASRLSDDVRSDVEALAARLGAASSPYSSAQEQR
jgi:ATP phosphoribosyltransferase